MTAEQRAGLSDAALAMTQPCIDELIKDISKRVQKAGAITDTAEYQIYRAQALGEGKKAIEQAVSKQIGISEEVIASLFEYVADKSLSPDENGSLKRMTEAYTRMTQSKTRELLRDLWADTPEGKVQPLQTAYARAMDFAFRQVATGTLDLNTAIRRAVTPLAKRGLRTIEQKSGRSVGIEYACRRYIMDQLGQLDDEIQHADHDALGCDGWEISAHAACAPDHEPIQGRQYGDAVNFMYFCHCSRLLVDVGDRVISGQQLAIMGETGNAEGTHPHCHFEVRATASGKGLDPTAYAAIPNKAGIYGAAPAADKPAEIPANSEKAATSLLQNITVGPVSSGDAAAVVAVCKEHDTTADSYTNAENHLQIICIRSVVQAVADAVLAVCKERKLTDAKLYTSHWA